MDGRKAAALNRGESDGQAIMQEEDDWLDWKAAREMLESWLGLRPGAA